MVLYEGDIEFPGSQGTICLEEPIWTMTELCPPKSLFVSAGFERGYIEVCARHWSYLSYHGDRNDVQGSYLGTQGLFILTEVEMVTMGSLYYIWATSVLWALWAWGASLMWIANYMKPFSFPHKQKLFNILESNYGHWDSNLSYSNSAASNRHSFSLPWYIAYFFNNN
jgi:hypothetical protein